MTSVVIKSISRPEIVRRVQALADDIRRRQPDVRHIYWFGSWINGQPTPGSDVDLCVVLGRSDKARRERASDLLPLGFPTGIDLVVYTEEEFARLSDERPAWHRCITSGRLL